MTKPIEDSPARDAYLDLVRAHEKLSGEFSTLFRAHGLTQVQFNVLRILLGGPREGVSCQYIGERLLNRVPDVTRLLDRMEAAGYLERQRSDEDRRVVVVRITTKGRRSCQQLYEPVEALHERQFAHMSSKAVTALSRGLRQIVEGA